MKGKYLFFSAKFSRLLEDWLAVTSTDEEGNIKKRTQKDFADYVGITQNMVTRYKKAEAYPSETTLEWIAQAFGVDVDTFIPTTTAEKIAFDEEYLNEFVEEIQEEEIKLIQEIGIDIGFWSFFTSIEKIYDIFPFEQIDDWNGVIFGRKNSKGQRVGFTKNDLLLVKKIQDDCEQHATLIMIKQHFLKG